MQGIGTRKIIKQNALMCVYDLHSLLLNHSKSTPIHQPLTPSNSHINDPVISRDLRCVHVCSKNNTNEPDNSIYCI